MANWLCLIHFSTYEVILTAVNALACILKTITQTNVFLMYKRYLQILYYVCSMSYKNSCS